MSDHHGRPGAIRKPSTKKGATKGTGGHSRKRLEGRGPTPKAEDRTYHPAYKRKQLAERAKEREAAREAARQPKLRGVLRLEEGYELIVGRNPVAEAVRAGVPLSRVFMVASAVGDERLGEVVRTATALGAPVIEVSRTELSRMCDDAVHQGVGIEVPPYEYAVLGDVLDELEGDRPGLFIALDSVTDPHNLGAALRSACAFGVDGVIIPQRRAAGVNATVWKVSAGAAARIPVIRVPNFVTALDELKDAGYFVVGLDGRGDTQIDKLPVVDMPLCLVTGSEGTGMARLTRDHCDVIATIPIASAMESLNAAVATGISLYQIDVSRRAAGIDTSR